MGLSVAECNKALNALAGRANYPHNSSGVYAQLHTGAPGASGTSNASSHTGRVLCAWNAPSGGAIATSAALVFSSLSLSGPETLTDVSFWDSGTAGAGNFLGTATLGSPATMNNGEPFTISAGLTQTISGTKFSDAVKHAILNAWAGLSTMTAYAAVYLSLHTGDPGSAGTSNPATETSRVAITFGTAAASGAIANTATAAWSGMAGPTAPTTQSISWGALHSASSGGTFLFRDDLATARSISSGDGVTLAIGELSLTLS